MQGKIVRWGTMSMVVLMVLVGFSVIPTAGCEDEDCCDKPCVSYRDTPLIIGQKEYDGCEIVVTHDSDNIIVTFSTDDSGWLITETHVAITVATYLDGIPQTKSGSPKVGQFSDSVIPDEPTDEVVVKVEVGDVADDPDDADDGFEWGTCIYIAAHAVVKKYNDCGEVVQEETAWGKGKPFERGWAMYFCYKPCNPDKTLLEMPDKKVQVNIDYKGDWRSQSSFISGYFTTEVKDIETGGNYNAVPKGTYIGWCVDTVGKIPEGDHWVQLISSYDGAGMPDDDRFDVSWDFINYILNHKVKSTDPLTYYSAGAIQDAIWYFTNGETPASGSDGEIVLADAMANGAGFYPSPGDFMAVIVYKEGYYSGDIPWQLTIIEVDP